MTRELFSVALWFSAQKTRKRFHKKEATAALPSYSPDSYCLFTKALKEIIKY